jgi:hypothetical protein
MRLLKKTIKPALRHKHHRDPIVPRVNRLPTENFKALATCICHVFSSITPNAPRKRRRNGYEQLLRTKTFNTFANLGNGSSRLRVLRYAPDHAVLTHKTSHS